MTSCPDVSGVGGKRAFGDLGSTYIVRNSCEPRKTGGKIANPRIEANLRTVWIATLTVGALAGIAQQQAHFNPVVDLLAAKKAAFGLYAPANPRVGGRGRGAPGAAQAGGAAGAVPTAAAMPTPPMKSPAELAAD